MLVGAYMKFICLGISHKTTPVELRENFSFTKSEIKNSLGTLYDKEGIREVAILSTCNRTEIYISGCLGSEKEIRK